jgi:geranylgeranyl reductase family protein
MINKKFDVIVIGLGPAGSSAAYHLGRAGIRVLAIEKERMPRYKTCAGGIPSRLVKLLDLDISAAIENEIRGAYICHHSRSVESPQEENAGYVVNRAVFDYLLALRAQEAGAEIREVETVREIFEQDGPADLIEVKTNRDVYLCRALIGADGVNGTSARYLGHSGRSGDIGIEVSVSNEYPVIRNNAHRLGFYFGDMPQGYGWIFPRKKNASVGIGISMKYSARAGKMLAGFLETLGIPAKLVEQAKGRRIPLFSPWAHRPYYRKNILLVGDAASFVDPITGEGIYYAIKSGEAAAQAIISTLPGGCLASAYAAALKKDILNELHAAWKISVPLYKFPRASFAFYEYNDRVRNLHFNISMGRASYAELADELPQNALSFLKLLLFRKIF